jgi:DMSO/TMAO reductase YedYZ molybdopterin-dependent catalytic subunit
VSFFDRNRKDLEARGIDPDRLPPGQYFTDRFPVLHVGDVPDYGDLSDWNLVVGGAVERKLTLSWADVLARPTINITTDIHCVTKWSKFDTHLDRLLAGGSHHRSGPIV